MGDILVVASKVKKFIRESAEMNTSAEAIQSLSEKVEQLCINAIENAKADKRKTIKSRDL